MKVITESFLRQQFRKEIPKTFEVAEEQIVTPSASQFLNEKRVKVVMVERIKVHEISSESSPEKENIPEYRKETKYVSAVDGGFYESKPEHMTQLHGNRLVSKDHSVIVFRGKLDSFQSAVLLQQHKASEGNRQKLVDDLYEILQRSRDVMRAEVTDWKIESSTMIGLTDPELREHSHNPKKYFGIGHLLPSFEMGGIILGLNSLRSMVREVEIASVAALKHDFQISKPYIIQTLNRMSSAIYIMMLKEKSGKYLSRSK